MAAGRRSPRRDVSGAGDLLAVATRELGEHEEPAGSNRVKYSAWYGMTAAWCAMFVSWCADQSGNTAYIPRHAYTPAGAAWFANRGRFDRTPRVGSLAFYDVSGMGRISHVGIVESVTAGGAWYAIEGNSNASGSRTGGQVCRVRRTTLGTFRGGFGHPDYPAVAITAARPWDGTLLRTGSRGAAVGAIQSGLNRALAAAGRQPLVVDGVFGSRTAAAVRWFQQARGLEVDGIIGRQTWTALVL